jgi:hypothetical protein
LVDAFELKIIRLGEYHPDRFVKQLPKPPDKPTAVWINPPPIKAGQMSLNCKRSSDALVQ